MLAGRCNGDMLGFVRLPLHHAAQTGGIEKAPLGIQPGRAHRVVVSMHLITHHQRLAWRAIDLPAVLVELLHCANFFALLRLPALQLPGKFADQVAAGNPCGQNQLLPGCRFLDAQRDMKQMRVRIGRSHGVADGRCWCHDDQSKNKVKVCGKAECALDSAKCSNIRQKQGNASTNDAVRRALGFTP